MSTEAQEPQQPAAPEEPDLLARQILDWLSTQGYPLEFRVAKAFERAGFSVSRGEYYSDSGPDGLVYREMDIHAQRSYVDMRAWTSAHVVAECKFSPYPWVVTTVASTPSKDGGRPLASGVDLEDVKYSYSYRNKGHDSYLLSRPGEYGFGLLDVPVPKATKGPQASGSRNQGRDNLGYTAAQVVAKAARFISESQSKGHPSLVFPVIVLDGPLYSLFYDDADAPVLRRQKWQRLMWAAAGAEIVSVDIVCAQHLEEFLARVKPEFDFLMPAMSLATMKPISSQREAAYESMLEDEQAEAAAADAEQAE